MGDRADRQQLISLTSLWKKGEGKKISQASSGTSKETEVTIVF